MSKYEIALAIRQMLGESFKNIGVDAEFIWNEKADASGHIIWIKQTDKNGNKKEYKITVENA